MADDRYLHEAGEDRENRSVRIFLDHNGANLVAKIYPGRPWWCAANLDRSVISQGAQGDVDVLIGPMTRREDQWIPDTDHLIAIEAKASLYDVNRQRSKSTHGGEIGRINGQLKWLVAQGFDRVCLLQILATNVSDEPRLNPIFQGLPNTREGLSKMMSLAPSLPAGCGYVVCAIGALPGAPEPLRGVTHTPIWVAEPKELTNRRVDQYFRDRIRNWLHLFPPSPIWPVVYLFCSDCGGVGPKYLHDMSGCKCDAGRPGDAGSC